MSECSTFEEGAGPPVAARTPDRLLALAALAALAGQAVIGTAGAPAVANGIVVAAVAVAAIAFVTARQSAASIAALCACVVVGYRTGLVWQVSMAGALAAFLALGRFVSPKVAPGRTWRTRGALPLGFTAFAAGVTPVALIGWLAVFRPDLHDVVARYVPALPMPVLALGALAFVVVNATLEEVIWRGVLQDHLEALHGAPAAIAIQAVSFGLQHAWGVPRGVAGVVLAGTWAVLLGLLRVRSRGLGAPIAAHVVADATIALLVLFVLAR